jgi:dihydrofolate reductase
MAGYRSAQTCRVESIAATWMFCSDTSAQSNHTAQFLEDVMGRIVVTEYMSLDGVIEAPGGGENYKHQGWSYAERGEEGVKFKLDETLAAEVQLLGRITYEGFAAAWPTMSDMPGLEQVAEKFNAMPKYVFSSTLEKADWNNSTILSGDFAEEIGRLKQQVDGVILVAGSAQLVQGLVEHDLVDEIRLMVFPVVLGSGKRLFGESADKTPLRLVDSKTVGAGIAVLTYEPA